MIQRCHVHQRDIQQRPRHILRTDNSLAELLRLRLLSLLTLRALDCLQNITLLIADEKHHNLALVNLQSKAVLLFSASTSAPERCISFLNIGKTENVVDGCFNAEAGTDFLLL